MLVLLHPRLGRHLFSRETHGHHGLGDPAEDSQSPRRRVSVAVGGQVECQATRYRTARVLAHLLSRVASWRATESMSKPVGQWAGRAFRPGMAISEGAVVGGG